MKSSLNRGISLRNSKRKRRSIGKRTYRELDDKIDYLTKYNIQYETKSKKKEKKKPKIRSIRINSEKPINKEKKEKKEKKENKEIDLINLLDMNTDSFDSDKDNKSSEIKKIKVEEIVPEEEIVTEEEIVPEEEIVQEEQSGGIQDQNIKKIFITNIEAEKDKNPLEL